MKFVRLLCWGLAVAACLPGANPELLRTAWHAKWIAPADAPAQDYGVYHFRRHLTLAAVPSTYLVHVSADNRYQLFVNGVRVSEGPARGDLNHWRYESVDLAKQLRVGENVIAAVVWNFGTMAPLAQVTYRTGFVLQGDSAAERVIDTDAQWVSVKDEAYSPIPVTNKDIRGYWAAGAAEKFDAALYPWGWERPEFPDSGWKHAVVIASAAPRDASDSPSRWMLIPRTIPPMEERMERIAQLRRSPTDITAVIGAGFPTQEAKVTVPAKQRVTLLLDQERLTTAYPELLFSGGKGATIKLQYAESLYVPGKQDKGNRDEIAGKEFVGYYDLVTADGGQHRMYRPLWWRTWRYMQVTVDTADEPLQIDDLHGISTYFPFERKSRLDVADPSLQGILDVGWRTAQLCAHETYMDCPYYEQLQYVGDTRIQAMVSLYATGDGRLMRNALELIDSSRTAEGATLSRAPSQLQQYIPPFSLWWIGMVRDYWWYQDDPETVKRMLPGVRAVLSFFERYQKENGSLTVLPWWDYVDWTRQWKGGVPPLEADGSSAPLDLQLLLGYQYARDLEQAVGSPAQAALYGERADRLASTIRQLYYDPARKLIADTPAKHTYSQHAVVLSVLAGVVKDDEAKDMLGRALADTSLVQCSIYFQSYALAALRIAGRGDEYVDHLGEWRSMLARGLSTWAESYEPSRSDCHAWGSSPNFELFRTVLGVDSASGGWRKVRIEPHLGGLKELGGTVPHPRGEVVVKLKRTGDRLVADVDLPGGTSGEFVWHGQTRTLAAGRSHLEF